MANQALQNLKRIHELQNEGEISQILRDIRASKGVVDAFGRDLINRRKEIEIQIQNSQKAPEPTIQETKEEVETKKPEPTFVEKSETNIKVFDNSNTNTPNNSFNQRRNIQNKAFKNHEQKPNNRNNFNKDKKDNRFNKPLG